MSFVVVAGSLAILAVEKVAHRLSPSLVGFLLRLAFVCVHAALFNGLTRFRLATSWAAVGKTGLARLQFELLAANGADFEGKYHAINFDTLNIFFQPQ